jgi:hypothetical protein
MKKTIFGPFWLHWYLVLYLYTENGSSQSGRFQYVEWDYQGW